MRKKIRDSRGETLVELLVAILVGALSIALLFGTVAVSIRLDRNAREADRKFYENLEKAEKQVSAGEITSILNRTVTVTTVEPAVTVSSNNLDVTFYGGDGVVSYILNK